MFVFVCAGCGADLTGPLSQVALPVHAHQKYGNGTQLPVLMEPGTFAVEPEPWGPPWRRWAEIDPDEAEARGIFAPVHGLSDNAPGAVVIAPGEAHGTVLNPENRGSGYCCGLDGAGGPNMACAACGQPVATRIDDCSLWQAVWLDPTAVRRLPFDGPEAPLLSWAELVKSGEGTPPFEPITRWGCRPGEEKRWSLWSPQWEAAAGRALAHLLVASDRRPVTVPDGLAAEVFQRALDSLLPAGPPSRHAVLAGPGLPALDADADILLVPAHPQTGQTWTPADSAASAYRVPLPFGVWQSMAFPEPYLPVPTSGRMPAGVLRDDYPLPPPRYHHPFQADPEIFRATLVRLPAVRTPWLREILDNLTRNMQAGIF
ncbi:hypothetical protein [Streptomyces xantholiticus]|uniref:hypothetical protein n=1 Tax=Streptomyces xantholiticus TaxID=68285 RepID=UPI00167C3CFF|nr:hypothetical protein [Streptomyces xantholiticus]GGW71451.1 hypothetical protein GCM10010381_65210 [Streptomyces xantholiticus]